MMTKSKYECFLMKKNPSEELFATDEHWFHWSMTTFLVHFTRKKKHELMKFKQTIINRSVDWPLVTYLWVWNVRIMCLHLKTKNHRLNKLTWKHAQKNTPLYFLFESKNVHAWIYVDITHFTFPPQITESGEYTHTGKKRKRKNRK